MNLWPVFYASDSTVGLLWPLLEFDGEKGTGRIPPFFWGKDYFVVFPLVWSTEDWEGVLPLFWWDDGFTVFPIVWYWDDGTFTLFPLVWRDGDGGYFHCFPLWLHWKEGSHTYDTHILWPVFRRLEGWQKTGFRVWPLLGHYRDKSGPGHYTYALWPLCHWREADGWTTRVAFPFYFEDGTKDAGWWLVVPVAFHWRARPDSLTITPIWSGGRKGETHWSALTPVYYHSVNRRKGTRRLITPLFARLKSPERTRWVFVPLGSSIAWGKAEKELWLFGPLVHARWGGGKTQHHVLPLYYYDGGEKMFLSPLVSRQALDDREFLNVGGVVAHYARARDGRKSLSFLWPLTGVSWGGDKDGEAVRLLPLFAWGREKWAEERHKAERRKRVLWVAPTLFFASTSRTPAEGPASAARAYNKHTAFAFPLWYYRRERAQEKRELHVRVLGWLYDHRRRSSTSPEGETRVKSRILWRLMRYRREGDDASLDVFPFITWDRKADGYRSVSFLWRLYRNERTAAGDRNVDVLFLPLLRRKAKPTAQEAGQG